MKEQKERKTTRLYDGNYNCAGSFFITICTKDKRCILSRIEAVPTADDSEAATVKLLPYGKTAEKYIRQLNDFYVNLTVDRYVIMPNHIHLLLTINNEDEQEHETSVQNSIISRFLSTFKRFCNKEYGENIWQYRSYDHIIRDARDYDEHLYYIIENPRRWVSDKLYNEE